MKFDDDKEATQTRLVREQKKFYPLILRTHN